MHVIQVFSAFISATIAENWLFSFHASSSRISHLSSIYKLMKNRECFHSMLNGLWSKIGPQINDSRGNVCYFVLIYFELFDSFYFLCVYLLSTGCLTVSSLVLCWAVKLIVFRWINVLNGCHCLMLNFNHYWQFQLKYILFIQCVSCEWNGNDNNGVNYKCWYISYLTIQPKQLIFSFHFFPTPSLLVSCVMIHIAKHIPIRL